MHEMRPSCFKRGNNKEGDVYDDKRNRLAPQKAEMLLFIKNNFKLCSEFVET